MNMLKIGIAGLALGLSATASLAADRCNVAWSHYIGWEPAHYIQEAGIAKRWGEKYNVDLEFVFVNDYIATIEQYAAGAFDGVTATTIDTLTIPAIGGVSSTILVVGDYSNGNDAIIVVDPAGEIQSVSDLKGRDIKLVEFSISDYLLQRALQMHNMNVRDVTLVNTSDADIGNLLASGGEGTVAVTWNPIVLTALATIEGAHSIYDSSTIPGEILDAVVVHSETSDACKSAITGAWYEAMSVMNADNEAANDAIAMMADFASGGTMGSDAVDWFNAQLATTQMFYEPEDGVAIAKSSSLKVATDNVRNFAFERGLLGDSAPSADVVGIQFPDGSILGDSNNVMMIFDASFMEKAAAGTL